MKRPAEPSEHDEQCAVITWAALNAAKWPALRLLYAVPNGAFFGGEVKQFASGKKVPVAAIRARKLKAEGLKEGVPDLCLPVSCASFLVPGCSREQGTKHQEQRTVHGLYIEMKRRTQGKPGAMQVWWREALIACGYHAVLCRGADEAIETLREYVKRAGKIELPELPEVKAKGARTLLSAAGKKRAGCEAAKRMPTVLSKRQAMPFLYPGSP